MTRSQLIAEIMAQVCAVTDKSDKALRSYVEENLRRAPLPILREVYSTNAMQRLVIGARAKKPSSLAPSPVPQTRTG